MSRIAVLAVGRRGVQLAGQVRDAIGCVDLYVPARLQSAIAGPLRTFETTIRQTVADIVHRYDGLVFFLPVGAVVRLIAPHAQDKRRDPAVVAVDEAGRFAVAVLAGHAGGANALATRVAQAIGARPVITTAAETLGTLALDLLGREHGWTIERGPVTAVSAAIVDGEPIGVYQEAGEEDWWATAPANVVRQRDLAAAEPPVRVIITDRLLDEPSPDAVVIRPRTLVVGVGCVRGAAADEIDALIVQTLARHRLALASVAGLATIDVKADEAGIVALAERRGWPLRLYRAEELNRVPGLASRSAHALKAVGAVGVCEPAALLAAGAAELVVSKTATSRVTVAIARRVFRPTTGKLSIVGIGPGSPADLTGRARAALQAADVVVGYQAYVDQVRPWLGDKEYRTSTIGEEVARARLAIDLARAGKRVALISSGDAGIFGMAGLALELLADQPAEADRVDVIPGITAAQAAAAILGAPLMSDFATISLSDLMTPWPVIVRRLVAVGEADLVVALYNPTSARRQPRFHEAVEILQRYRPPETPVGVVRNATRPGQTVTITDLGHLLETPIDMLTVVVVGNRATIRIGNRLVTRRGYPVNGEEGRCDGS